MLRDAVVRSGAKGDRYIVELRLHPAATATLTVMPDGELQVGGDAAALGPGYVAAVNDKLSPILDELDYVWTEPFDLATTQLALCDAVGCAIHASDVEVRIGIPEERRFRIDAPVLTALGPRDHAWRSAVLTDHLTHARDAFAWWEPGPGREALSRALLALSLEVPWREPLDQAERDLMLKVHEDLRAARKADPALPLPYAEWAELLKHLGSDDKEITAQAGDREPALGYRRYDLEVELSGGWRIVIPGSFVGHWEDEGAKYWATDGDRAIEFSSLTANDEHDSAKLLAVAPERYPVLERITEDARHGRAESHAEDGVPILIGLMVVAPHVGILTCKGGTQDWALATWRSLRR